MKAITTKQKERFQKKIFDWWKENKRELPWRETTDPYYIMISEIMLQQTQVSRSIEKYLEFIEKFPTVKNLAEAETAEVLKTWSGLGYNRRALWLQEAAKQILVEKEFPKTPEALEKLKGIGKYTARSILIFAFNYDLPTVDTNIRRIMIAEGFATEETSENDLFDIAGKLLPKGKARDWHNALMDYGAIEVTARKTGIKPKTTQSKFTNSTRFLRGKIVKLLTQKEKMSKEDLISNCEVTQLELEEILEKLIVDGLITKINEKYQLP